MATEAEYDEIIAPMLADVAKRCDELGMAMVARVEWEPGEAGITQIGDNKISAGQRIAHLAALAKGNIDALCIAVIKEFDVSQSMVLHSFKPKS